MTAQLQAVTHGTSGLAMAYVLVLVALVGGLAQARAAAHKYLLAPLLAAPLLLLMALCISLLGALLHAVGLSGGWIQLSIGFLGSMAIGFVAGRVLALRRPKRGIRSIDAARSSRKHLPRKSAKCILRRLSSWPASQSHWLDETKHFKIIGTTGTGKSTAIREILSAALARGDRVVIADPDAGYLNRYYDPNRGT